MPTWETPQLFLPSARPTCSDHFQPGSYVALPMVMPPRWTSSNLPLSKLLTSSGWSKRLRMTSYMGASGPFAVRSDSAGLLFHVRIWQTGTDLDVKPVRFNVE
jgi:hypothetical protein